MIFAQKMMMSKDDDVTLYIYTQVKSFRTIFVYFRWKIPLILNLSSAQALILFANRAILRFFFSILMLTLSVQMVERKIKPSMQKCKYSEETKMQIFFDEKHIAYFSMEFEMEFAQRLKVKSTRAASEREIERKYSSKEESQTIQN